MVTVETLACALLQNTPARAGETRTTNLSTVDVFLVIGIGPTAQAVMAIR